MKQKMLKLTFKNADGEVPSMCKCPANMEQIGAALAFLDVDCQLSVTVVESDAPAIK